NVNLSKIESRPSKGKLGDYVFYVDLQGHIEDENVKEALSEVEKVAFVKILGSYPRKY
ncbi:prephenate dehydratase, partial [Patescibacteria group bacterium]|nr:prephenate dehydratase [Patescibacteria group bacterium]